MLRMTQASLKAGAVTVLETLENISNVRKDQQSLALAKYDYLFNLIEILILSGIISPKDIHNINQDLSQELAIPD